MLNPRERLMTFEEAADLDPDEQDEGRWVPVTKGSWRHGQIVVDLCAIE
ncbi:MAG: hypothetical protein ACYCW6_22395 [Candidatus Xenobia bacterium]